MRSKTVLFLVMAMVLSGLDGCMTVTVNYNVSDHSTVSGNPISQAKPVDASPYLSTTGTDIGKAINAAFGGIDLSGIPGALKDLKAQIDALKAKGAQQ
jgi:hypothetical protein